MRWLFLLAVACAGAGVGLRAAEAPATREAGPGDEPVTMEFPADGVELKVLADIVTRRLKVPVLYDESIANKKVVIRVPVDVPESALMGVLQGALRMKQMALVDAEQPGWKKIVPAANLAQVAQPVGADGAAQMGAAVPVTQVFAIKQGDPGRLVEAVRPLLSQPGGSVQPVAGALVVSDYASVVSRVGELIKLLDAQGSAAEVRFVRLKEADAAAVVTAITAAVAGQDAAAGGAGGAGVQLSADERGNQVIVTGPAERVKEVLTMIEGMDRPADLATRVYRLKHVSPERVDRLVKGLAGGERKGYQATVDEESNSLVVAATEGIHAQIGALVKELDAPVASTQSPVRFYKLKNTKAPDVLATIASLYGEEGPRARRDEPTPARDRERDRDGAAVEPRGARPATVAPAEGAVPEGRADDLVPRDAASSTPRMTAEGTAAGSSRVPADESRALPNQSRADRRSAPGVVKTSNGTITADVNTNSVIVIAPPAVQQTYAELIARLDVRRPQVQVECTIVTIDTTDGFSLGVDVGVAGGSGADNQIISFGSFGVSVVDPVSASLTPTRGRGGTFALLSPGNADIVLRALATNSRSRLVSAPQLLVNDNGRGKLQSVSQEPYAEILDTGTTQSRTGLGGLAQAGTTILVEPNISEGDYLQLTYSVELSSFTGQGQDGLPPPSVKNTVDSVVTIPDGHTIVVGGLTTRSLRADDQSIPGLNQVPIIKDILGSKTKTAREATLFVFMRPVILRDDKFEDLKFLSERKTREAGVPGSYPKSRPVAMR